MKTYLNYEVFSQPLNEADPGQERRAGKLSVVSSSVGMSRVYDKRGFPVRTRTVNLVAAGAQAVQELRAFVLRRRGRVVPVWMRTGLADLVVATEAVVGATLVNLQSPQYAALFASGARSHLWIGGEPYEVQAATAGAMTTTVQLKVGLNAAVAAGARVEHLLLYRLSADEVAIDFEGTDFASAALELTEIPNEA